MKHRKNNRTLQRQAHHRSYLLKNLTSSLLERGKLTTTAARAKELRGWFEPLVTKAKGEVSLHTRRQLLSELMHKSDFPRLVEVAQAHKSRPGGYLRLTKLPVTRNDGAQEINVEIIDYGN